jgi:hypothetical protein
MGIDSTGEGHMAVLDQPCPRAPSLTSSEATGASVGHDAPELDIDSNTIRGDEDDFIAHMAVLGALNFKLGKDVRETDLLRRIWRAYGDLYYSYVDIRYATNPFYVKPEVNEIIASMRTIAILMEELDRHRQMVAIELQHKYGIPDCTILRNGRGTTLIASDQHLEEFFFNYIYELDRIIISQCRKQARILRNTAECHLCGTNSQDPDRREWEAEFRRLIIVTEGNSSKLRLKMMERRLGLERAAARRKNELDKTPSAFAVAKNVPKAIRPLLQ